MTDYDTLISRLLIVFRESFTEGMQVDADHALSFALRDVCSHLAAEVITLDEMRRGITLLDAIRFLSAAGEEEP